MRVQKTRKINESYGVRQKTGSTIVLICFLTAVVCTGGAAFALCGMILGGTQELQHATDSGILNVGKQYLKSPGESLQPGVEANNFPDLIDSNGTITLNTYNRAVAQSLIVSLNAKAEGTETAMVNAQALSNSLHATSNSIGQRLCQALSRGDSASPVFLSLANLFRLKMLGANSNVQFQAADFKAGYVKRGGSTNVFLDPSIIPSGVDLPAVCLSSKTSANGQNYLIGYRDITVDGISTVQGVSLQPQCQPHLISLEELTSAIEPPTPTLAVPPNSFAARTSALESVSNHMAFSTSASIVGSLTSEYAASIPGGYLVVGYVDATSSSSQTITDLLTSVGNGADTSIFPQMKQRLREVKPTATAAEMDAFLASITLSSGQTAFIFLDQATNSFTYTTCSSAPRHIAGTNPDGTPQQYTSSGLVLVSTMPSSPPPGNSAYYVPSSGFNNLLGSLVVYRQAIFAAATGPGSGGPGAGSGTTTGGEPGAHYGPGDYGGEATASDPGICDGSNGPGDGPGPGATGTAGAGTCGTDGTGSAGTCGSSGGAGGTGAGGTGGTGAGGTGGACGTGDASGAACGDASGGSCGSSSGDSGGSSGGGDD